MNCKLSSEYGRIVILNGAPRAGKSSIATAIQNSFEGIWINLGVDSYMKMIPEKYQPGIGLRPGGERPDLEPFIVTMYLALYESIAVHSRLGINVIADVGHHNSYSTPLRILPHCAKILRDYPVLFVGVKCPIETIMERRKNTGYPGYDENGSIRKPILRWQESVHSHGIYDIEVDTSLSTAEEIAEVIRKNLHECNFTAFKHLADSIFE